MATSASAKLPVGMRRRRGSSQIGRCERGAQSGPRWGYRHRPPRGRRSESRAPGRLGLGRSYGPDAPPALSRTLSAARLAFDCVVNGSPDEATVCPLLDFARQRQESPDS